MTFATGAAAPGETIDAQQEWPGDLDELLQRLIRDFQEAEEISGRARRSGAIAGFSRRPAMDRRRSRDPAPSPPADRLEQHHRSQDRTAPRPRASRPV